MSNSLGDVIAYNLSLDLTFGDPQTIYLNNMLTYSSSADVPVYLYTPLWSFLGCPSSDLSDFIIPNYGEAKIPTSPCIVIQPTDNTESVMSSGDSYKSDKLGARTAYMDILVKNIVTNKDIDRVENTLERINYLIDFLARQERTTPEFPFLEIPSSITGYSRMSFTCAFCDASIPFAKEGSYRFRVQYNKLLST